eukprot:1180213-Prorocentrum_minimum.AAC.1
MYTNILRKISGLLTRTPLKLPQVLYPLDNLFQQVPKSPHVSKFPPVCTRQLYQLLSYVSPRCISLAVKGFLKDMDIRGKRRWEEASAGEPEGVPGTSQYHTFDGERDAGGVDAETTAESAKA